jgi:DUF4097 and DUF4098 domain-containing protein YvlB
MKSKKMTPAALILVLLLGGKATASEPDFFQGEKTFPIKKGGTLNMNLNPGTITIIPWERDEIKVTIPLLDKEEQQSVHYTQGQNSLRIEYNSDWAGEEEAAFTVFVPSVINLELVTKSGEVHLRGNITGSVDVKSYAGDLTVMDITGITSLNTSGGEIRTGDIRGDSNLNTLGGDITTGQLIGGAAKLTTMGGDIRIHSSTAAISAKTMGGDITTGSLGNGSDLVTYGGTITTGRVLGGIKLNSMGGDLILDGAEGAVSAKTMGGDITLHRVRGSITAKTYAGKITAELDPAAGSLSDISTSSGEIIFLIPANANALISAKAKVPGGPSNFEKAIKSDFKEQTFIEKSRYTLAEYKLGNGEGMINLTSTDAGIRILKNPVK